MMVNTVEVKMQQLKHGFFTTGSGPEVILVLGSCRVVNYVTYLRDWNAAHGNRFTIHTLDPFNWNWSESDERVDYGEVINKLETNRIMLDMLKSVDIFIHEYYANFGMFNCDKNGEKNIYQFGMFPDVDICLPNFNDLFILFGDIVTFDTEARKKASQDFNAIGSLSRQTEEYIFFLSQTALQKFYDVCNKSGMPEFGLWFSQNFRRKRLFWSYNHTSKHFTMEVFKRIAPHLGIELVKGEGWKPNHEDIFANNYTKLTTYDLNWYGYEWGEEVISLRERL